MSCYSVPHTLCPRVRTEPTLILSVLTRTHSESQQFSEERRNHAAVLARKD